MSVRLPSPRRLTSLFARLARDTAGNTLMIIAAALFPLLAMVGGGLDIGRGYLVQSRLQQACDAGVLAARKRLGPEAVTSGAIPLGTAEIGDRFFRTNFTSSAYGTTTRSFEMTLEEDYSISGLASARMPTTIMGIFGEQFIDVTAECSAQLNTSNTDVMMVLDVTGSMAQTNAGDTKPRIDVLKDVIKTFHTQLSASAMIGSRIRYGFLPYSTNVNVGHLLKDEWVVTDWAYQSRKYNTTLGIGSRTYETQPVAVSGSAHESLQETYPATKQGQSYSCLTKPADSVAESLSLVSESSDIVIGPPPGTRTTKTYQRSRNGASYNVNMDGRTCTVIKTQYTDYVDTYDEVTEPSYSDDNKWVYDRLYYDVSDWRSESNGCIEERQTYEIDDYNNVDFNRALDLNIDLVPTENPGGLGIPILEALLIGEGGDKGKGKGKGKGEDDDDEDDDDDEEGEYGSTTSTTLDDASVTKWRPMYPDQIFARELQWNGGGKMKDKRKVTSKEYFAPAAAGYAACPAPAAKLSEMSDTQLDGYLDTLVPVGSTYHDIGMIWGGRLISPTGLFAAENADVTPASPTRRNLIFLTDGETAPLDLSYGTYGLEPIDQRRWSPKSKLTLTEVVENRFKVACDEVKKRGVTVWVIGFGTELNQMMKDCAGEGKFFEAADAAELNASFGAIAKTVSELRIVN